MWTSNAHARYGRSALRYPSDLTDEEWLRIGPLLPQAQHGRRKLEVNIREVVNRVMFVLSTGYQ